MGLFSGLMGHGSEVDGDRLDELFGPVLVEGEQVDKAFQLIRDLFVFTNKRLVLVDKQGLTGKKMEMLSIPYGKITKYSFETAGHFDMDAEIRLWVGSEPEPIKKEIARGTDIRELYQVLSSHLL
ncbi:PH domain-containing protein [Gallaecimonas sp. GXIMD4217]|uniref:PH domain-containing protein n=1 Tax=Gallaecimonas sp. GXIMD4217 TaxID=3131927 RepID=UPI00311ADB0E